MNTSSFAIKVLGVGVSSALRLLPRSVPGRSVLARFWQKYFAWRDCQLPGYTSFGAKMSLKPCDSIQGRILTTGVWEPVISQVIADALGPGDVFIDVGANVGYYTLMAAEKTGAAGRVFSVEASPSVFADLSANVAINSYANVTVINAAISDRAGEIPIFLAASSNVGHSTIIQKLASAEGHRQEAMVRADVLQECVPLEALLSARLVKIDIEGAERLAIAGVAPLLAKFSNRTEWLMELSPEFSPGGQSDVDWIFETFLESGYRCYLISNDYANPEQRSQVDPGLQPCSAAPTKRLSDVLFTKQR